MTKYITIAMALVLVSVYAFAQQDDSYRDYVQSIESMWDDYSDAKEFEEFKKQHFCRTDYCSS